MHTTMPPRRRNRLTILLILFACTAAFGRDGVTSKPQAAKATRVELTHLTVSEYRNAVADLVGVIGATSTSDKSPGLRGQYSNSTGKRARSVLFTRVDPNVRFDFGPSNSDFDKLSTTPFSVTWEGSVLPPDTGMYDFIVKTEHGMRLWVNDLKRPLIDASVKSGSETEFRSSIFLLGGRAYAIKLDFVRGNVGVRKEIKEKPAPVKTTISLEWKPPLSAAQVIPARNLTPAQSGMLFAPATPFPPDDKSFGYERGIAVSKAWVQAVTDGAIETAEYVVANLPELSGVAADASDRKTRLREYCLKFAERAFRRPLTEPQKKLYIDRHFEEAKSVDDAVTRVALLVLQSPLFLYREPGAGSGMKRDAYDVASQLSFGLWDSLPDQELLKAAATDRLKTREDLLREANRMMADPRARTKMHSFLLQWLRLDQFAELTKDAKLFPGFDTAVVSDLRSSLELFVDDVIWSEASDFRQLFMAEHVFLNDRLAPLYGGELPADEQLRKVLPKSGQHAGLVTHPYLMASFAYPHSSSPIHRGVFLARDVLGVALKPPPDAFEPFPPELHPKLTTRQRVALQTGPRECRTCHSVIDQLGFTLENYDAIGRFRSLENALMIDASGSYMDRSGQKVTFTGPRELAKFLAASEETHETFVAKLFHHLVKQPIHAFGPDKLGEMRRFFADNNYNIRRQVVESVVQAALAQKM